MMGFAIVQGTCTHWIDTMTGTFGSAHELVLFNDPPEDFADWSDKERVEWVWRQRGAL